MQAYEQLDVELAAGHGSGASSASSGAAEGAGGGQGQDAAEALPVDGTQVARAVKVIRARIQPKPWRTRREGRDDDEGGS